MVVGGNKGFDCVGRSRMYSNIPRDANNWVPNIEDWMIIIQNVERLTYIMVVTVIFLQF